MPSSPPNEKATDFSKFFKKDSVAETPPQLIFENNSPKKHLRLFIFLITAGVLFVIEIVLILFSNIITDYSKPNTGPTGYHLVTSKNGPSYFQKNK